MKLRQANIDDLPAIWQILQDAIAKRKAEGSSQWQNGYPNLKTIRQDIQLQYGFVLEDKNEICAYAAVIFNDEPTYETIQDKWLSEGEFAVIHRIATARDKRGKGYATKMLLLIEDYCTQKGIPSIKIDTNHDNEDMLHILEKLQYTYCGIIFTEEGEERKAFEKIQLSRLSVSSL